MRPVSGGTFLDFVRNVTRTTCFDTHWERLERQSLMTQPRDICEGSGCFAEAGFAPPEGQGVSFWYVVVKPLVPIRHRRQAPTTEGYKPGKKQIL